MIGNIKLTLVTWKLVTRNAFFPHMSNMSPDFSNNSPKTKVIVARTPPSAGFVAPRPVKPRAPDEYVDMSPRAGYVEMRPLDVLAPLAAMTLARSPPARGPSR